MRLVRRPLDVEPQRAMRHQPRQFSVGRLRFAKLPGPIAGRQPVDDLGIRPFLQPIPDVPAVTNCVRWFPLAAQNDSLVVLANSFGKRHR